MITARELEEIRSDVRRRRAALAQQLTGEHRFDEKARSLLDEWSHASERMRVCDATIRAKGGATYSTRRGVILLRPEVRTRERAERKAMRCLIALGLTPL